MVQIFGNFIQELSGQDEFITLSFSPSSLALRHHWEKNGLSADFIGEYFKVFFVGHEKLASQRTTGLHDLENLKDAVKYISNELLENAMKFQDTALPFPTKITFSLLDNKLIFYVVNGVTAKQMTILKDYIQQLLCNNPEYLYLQTMKKTSLHSKNQYSRLGLLSMICDYSAQIGWKFETMQKDIPITTVTTMVCLKL